MEPSGRAIWGFLVNAYDDWAGLIVTNLLWFVFTIPVVTAPAAIAGLYYATSELSRGRSAGWETFMEGFRNCFWLGWRWTLLNLFILATLLANIVFYGQFQARWALWVQGLFLGLVVLWSALQVYTFPLLLEQDDRRLIVALRNSLVLYLKKPGFSIGLILALALIAMLSTILALPWLLFTPSLIAFLGNSSVRHLLKIIPTGTKVT